ncbi:MAG: hypothetical protein V2A71_03725, partial [Candidatus Eisenbacteria bacterium]
LDPTTPNGVLLPMGDSPFGFRPSSRFSYFTRKDMSPSASYTPFNCSSGQPAEIVAIALKAQHRLSRRFYHLSHKKHLRVAITAVARELCGFVWAIMKAAPQHYL